MLDRALQATAALWPDVERAYAWVHAAAHALGNEDDAPARLVRRRFDRVLAKMQRDASQAGSLQGVIRHFCKVSRSWRSGLFHCYSMPELPRTNNDLEHLFGSYRYHERRASGRKVASPATVLRGSARLIAATATRLRAPTARELGRVNRKDWAELRKRLEQRRHARVLRVRFRRDPQQYLAELEQLARQSGLPS